jgi:hypothetical protein
MTVTYGSANGMMTLTLFSAMTSTWGCLLAIRDSYEADGTALAPDLPLVLLVNRGTASASEVRSGDQTKQGVCFSLMMPFILLQTRHRAKFVMAVCFDRRGLGAGDCLKEFVLHLLMRATEAAARAVQTALYAPFAGVCKRSSR